MCVQDQGPTRDGMAPPFPITISLSCNPDVDSQLAEKGISGVPAVRSFRRCLLARLQHHLGVEWQGLRKGLAYEIQVYKGKRY